MTELLIFTVLATIAAVYAVLPKHRQLRIGYSFGRRLRIVAIILVFGILLFYVGSLYLTYVASMVSIPRIGTVEASILRFITEVLQLVLSVAIVGLLLTVLLKDPPNIRNEEFLRDQMQELMNNSQYNTLVSVLKDNYNTLIKEPENSENSAAQYTKTVLLNKEFAEQYALNNPQLGVRLINDTEIDEFPRIEAVNLYLQALVKHESSIFYREIQNNKHRTDTNRFEIPENNQLLHALLSDCDIAHQLRAYKSIGDRILQILQEQGRKDRDEYNHRQETFTTSHDSDDVFRDPVFVGIRFFDIMVSESIYQGMETHMWLYYYLYFTDEICENYEITEHSDPIGEFANGYSYLLYTMFSNLKYWVRLSDRNPDSITMNIQDASAAVENGDILKSSARCLIQCHRKILTTSEIPSRFKSERTESLFRTYFELASSQNSEAQKYGEALLAYMEQDLKAFSNSPPSYRIELESVFSNIENELRIKQPRSMTLVDDIKSRLNL